jgi:hypothetical protein
MPMPIPATEFPRDWQHLDPSGFGPFGAGAGQREPGQIHDYSTIRQRWCVFPALWSLRRSIRLFMPVSSARGSQRSECTSEWRVHTVGQ